MTKKPGNSSRFYLGLFMLLVTVVFTGLSFYFLEWYHVVVYFDILFYISALLTFPVYYLYIRFLTVGRSDKGRIFIHGLPALIAGGFLVLIRLLFSSPYSENPGLYFSENLSLSHAYYHPEYLFINLVKLLFLFQAIYYLSEGTRLIKQFRQRLADYYSDWGNRDAGLVRILHHTFIASAFLFVVFGIIGRDRVADQPWLMLVFSLLASGVIFTLGLLGNLQSQKERHAEPDDPHEKAPAVYTGKPVHELKERLELLFHQERVFLKKDHTIWDVSSALGTNRTYISELINEEYGMNFSRFVNQFRIGEAKRMLKDRQARYLPVETIGEQCGFGSLNNFIRVFRDFENTTPGKYRENHGA